MTTFQKILFPVDFSERSRAAAPFVLALAQRYHATITLLHAIHPPPPTYGGMETIYPEVFDFTEYRTTLTQELEKFGATELPRVDIICAVGMGDAARVITDYVDENGVDLIAIPTHGYGVFRRALLGSVAARVLHDVRIPVWTSAHAPEQSHRAHPQPRRIVVGLDLKQDCVQPLRVALQLARDTGAAVSAVHAVAPGMMIPGMPGKKLEELLIEGARTRFASMQFDGCHALETVFEIGSPAALIRSVCLAKRADLVVIGRTGHNLPERMNDFTNSIIREAPCPVLSL